MRELESGTQYDMYLLDMLMPFINGLELAKEIRERDHFTPIMFLTNSPEYALDSYDYDVCAYLLKPIQPAKLEKALDKAISIKKDVSNDGFLIQTRNYLQRIHYYELEAIEINGVKLNFYLRNGKQFVTNGKMRDLELQLRPHSEFIKPHRSYLINMEHISSIQSNEILLSSGRSVPVARKEIQNIKDLYINFMITKAKGETL